MTDDLFLQAIREAPHRDEPRLMYADWLLERGDPRGEFIRLQCELSRLPSRHPQVQPCRRRVAELLRQHEAEWVGPLSNLVRAWSFHRGFITEVTATPRQFLDAADDLFRLVPLRGVRFCEARRWGTRLAMCPHLARLELLDFRVDFHPVRGLAPSWLGVYPLGEQNDVIDLVDLQALLASPHLKALRWLNLDNLRLGPAGVRALTQARIVGRLRRLDLDGNDLGANAIASLTACRRLTRLRTLSLAANELGPLEVAMLADARHLVGLRRLNLRDNQIGSMTVGGKAVGIRQLAAATGLPALRWLDVRGNGIGPQDRRALIERFGANVRC